MHVAISAILTFLAISFIDVISAFCFWIYFNQPDFYFRGWNGVVIHLFLWLIIGALSGLLYGFLLTNVEYILKKRIWTKFLFIWLIVSAIILFSINNYFVMKNFSLNPLPLDFYQLFIILCGVGMIISILSKNEKLIKLLRER